MSFAVFVLFESDLFLFMHLIFLIAYQACDDLLEDMDLPIMRSGGTWFTWPFKVVDLKEIETLRAERAGKRETRPSS